MIDNITISNFKSILNLSLELGRVNVLIGENGCGKTNVLEALSFASVVAQDNLSVASLSARMRYVDEKFMTPAFEDIEATPDSQKITITTHDRLSAPIGYSAMYYQRKNEWLSSVQEPEEKDVMKVLGQILEINPDFFSSWEKENAIVQAIKQYDLSQLNEVERDVVVFMKNAMLEMSSIKSYMIYNLDEVALRQFKAESQTLPLGRNGEGLFQYLRKIEKEQHETYKEILENLSIFDWFDGAHIPDNLLSNEYKLLIGDRYLSPTLHEFDQRSVNEGFLFMLFYLTLFISKDTPEFFAIDNIERAFNPKMCVRLVQLLSKLAKQYHKQVIFTTHNPYVLDGLDLEDGSQCLFVAYRNVDGHTNLSKVPYREKRTLKLSELWMSGVLGGLPENF